MTNSTSDAICSAVQHVSAGIANGTLVSRLCFICGQVWWDGHYCCAPPLRENRVREMFPPIRSGVSAK